MAINVKVVNDKTNPVEIEIWAGNKQHLTLKGAVELKTKLETVIEKLTINEDVKL